MSEKVLLTGISGWIAKHTAIELLNSGYEVLGTVRNKNLIEQTKETLSKYASIDKLSFVELDLLKDDVWNESAKGCKYIMHVASPFPIKVSKNRDILLPVAVDGTLRVYAKRSEGGLVWIDTGFRVLARRSRSQINKYGAKSLGRSRSARDAGRH